jgi:hypothetical protein
MQILLCPDYIVLIAALLDGLERLLNASKVFVDKSLFVTLIRLK